MANEPVEENPNVPWQLVGAMRLSFWSFPGTRGQRGLAVHRQQARDRRVQIVILVIRLHGHLALVGGDDTPPPGTSGGPSTKGFRNV